MKFTTLLKRLDELELPPDQYAIFGSGPLAIRGLRKARDLDILVTPHLFQQLKSQHPTKMINQNEIVEIGDIEAMITWPQLSSSQVQQMIQDSEMIEGHPFVKLDHLLKSKKILNRPKDQRDIKLIQEYLKQQSTD